MRERDQVVQPGMETPFARRTAELLPVIYFSRAYPY